MNGLLQKLTVLLALGACAPAPGYQKDESLLYHLRHMNDPPPKVEHYQAFSQTTPPVTVVAGDTSITYQGDIETDGYCLIVAHPGVEINMYCTTTGRQVDVWSYQQGDMVSQRRSENPHGCNGKSWDSLDEIFSELVGKFIEAGSTDPGYPAAVIRMKGGWKYLPLQERPAIPTSHR